MKMNDISLIGIIFLGKRSPKLKNKRYDVFSQEM